MLNDMKMCPRSHHIMRAKWERGELGFQGIRKLRRKWVCGSCGHEEDVPPEEISMFDRNRERPARLKTSAGEVALFMETFPLRGSMPSWSLQHDTHEAHKMCRELEQLRNENLLLHERVEELEKDDE